MYVDWNIYNIDQTSISYKYQKTMMKSLQKNIKILESLGMLKNPLKAINDYSQFKVWFEMEK